MGPRKRTRRTAGAAARSASPVAATVAQLQSELADARASFADVRQSIASKDQVIAELKAHLENVVASKDEVIEILKARLEEVVASKEEVVASKDEVIALQRRLLALSGTPMHQTATVLGAPRSRPESAPAALALTGPATIAASQCSLPVAERVLTALDFSLEVKEYTTSSVDLAHLTIVYPQWTYPRATNEATLTRQALDYLNSLRVPFCQFSDVTGITASTHIKVDGHLTKVTCQGDVMAIAPVHATSTHKWDLALCLVELKLNPPTTANHAQAIIQLILANVLNVAGNRPFVCLTDMITLWEFFWLNEDKTIGRSGLGDRQQGMAFLQEALDPSGALPNLPIHGRLQYDRRQSGPLQGGSQGNVDDIGALSDFYEELPASRRLQLDIQTAFSTFLPHIPKSAFHIEVPHLAEESAFSTDVCGPVVV